VACVAYVPRTGNDTVLHTVVRDHLEALLAAIAAAGDGHALPYFVRTSAPLDQPNVDGR
jgi:hypothetical protein